jgi:hypothetical protein
LNAHRWRDVVTQLVAVGTTIREQSLPGEHGATAAPPEQEVDFSSKQTIPAPQSGSVVQVLAWQDLMICGFGGARSAGLSQGVLGGQAGAVPLMTVPESTQAKLWGQSLSWVQVCAVALRATLKTAVSAMVTVSRFIRDMMKSLSLVRSRLSFNTKQNPCHRSAAPDPRKMAPSSRNPEGRSQFSEVARAHRRTFSCGRGVRQPCILRHNYVGRKSGFWGVNADRIQ